MLDRDTASRLGLTTTTIDNTLYDAFGQRQISTMFTQVNQYHVILEVDPKFQQDPADLNNIYITPSTSGITAATGTTVRVDIVAVAGTASAATTTSSATSGQPGMAAPLSAFTHWATEAGPLTINHQGQFPVITLSFNLAPGVSLSDAVTAIDQAKKTSTCRRASRPPSRARRRRSRPR